MDQAQTQPESDYVHPEDRMKPETKKRLVTADKNYRFARLKFQEILQSPRLVESRSSDGIYPSPFYHEDHSESPDVKIFKQAFGELVESYNIFIAAEREVRHARGQYWSEHLTVSENLDKEIRDSDSEGFVRQGATGFGHPG